MNANEPAFPVPKQSRLTYFGTLFHTHGGGLTKRELFAMAALNGFCAMPGDADLSRTIKSADDMARLCVRYADALLAALEKNP